MRTNREALLKVLESLTPGLATREIIEQSSCLVFMGDGRAATFNDEVCASRQSPLKIVGAVKAKPLLDLLTKLVEDEIDVEQVNGELKVLGKMKKAGIRMEAEVMLPVESVEIPETWRPLPTEFSEGVSIVFPCASTEESKFYLTCVHISADFIEASDRLQIARYPVKTGVSESTLVRAQSLRKILGYDMTEIAETPSWVHFRNPAGLVLSIRRYLEDYPDLGRFLTSEGTIPVALPGGLEEVVSKAEIFSCEKAEGNHVLVDIKADRLMIEGTGATGYYKEGKKISYQGPPMRFSIAPKLLVEITKKSNECGVSTNRLYVNGGKFEYITSTKVVEEKKVEFGQED